MTNIRIVSKMPSFKAAMGVLTLLANHFRSFTKVLRNQSCVDAEMIDPIHTMSHTLMSPAGCLTQFCISFVRGKLCAYRNQKTLAILPLSCSMKAKLIIFLVE